MSNQNSSWRYLVISLQFFKVRRNWRPVILAWIISVILEIASWQFKITGDANLAMAILNGSLIWLTLSLLLLVGEYLCYVVFHLWMHLDIASHYIAFAVDGLIVIFSGTILTTILHLTNTATPASWGWYFVLGVLHCIRAGQLRKKKYIYKIV